MSSGTSTSSSSSTGSESSPSDAEDEGDGLNAFFGGQRPNLKDYESYTTLVRRIDRGDTSVAKRILAARPFELDTLAQTNHVQDREGEDNQEDPIEDQATKQKKKRSRQTKVDARQTVGTAWPLRLSDITQEPGDELENLEDAILAFASAYVREKQLVHPRQPIDTDPTDPIELNEVIPALLPNVMEQVNSLLSSLATMRPEASGRGRAMLKPMDWRSVISAGVLSDIDPSILSKTNRKMRGILDIEGDDLLQYRFDKLASIGAEPSGIQPVHELLSQARVKQPKGSQRVHSTREEQERRASKREAKAARRLEQAGTGRPLKRRRKAKDPVP